MLSKACEYAIRASIIIASESQQKNRPGLTEIAEKINSPVAFTAKILQKLVKNKILMSIKGPGGGFEADKNALGTIRLIDIVLAIDGISPFSSCSLGLNECSEHNPCPVHHKYKPIKEKLIEMFDKTTLEELVNAYKAGKTFLKLPDMS
ncbi:MAG TPA: Rrf2 family transcriptional regulator [Saprospiraceae bacterium]|nr:Rrf2 family transcriptional regulator [Saprospiraceae bacterium]MCC6688219.1 Rrf2 family transcriptional regulator [Saprospiraceae bacterium]HMX83458.1 Rrf2 family transcriptional regulator [Saprospiraceae bacterium]HMX86179.1 Rrf2 family transcriptional regulator [Saprospiraceae bacterium]HMZ73694.1 Rrf2 family transcriptional regulator [Saprospiraceae bacterium]